MREKFDKYWHNYSVILAVAVWPILKPDNWKELVVLNWWKNNQQRFPILSNMATDILSISITTVASESAFSIGSRVLTKYRSFIFPYNVQALICTHNWMHGFTYDSNLLIYMYFVFVIELFIYLITNT